jgi:hypothetical protein
MTTEFWWGNLLDKITKEMKVEWIVRIEYLWNWIGILSSGEFRYQGTNSKAI